MKNPRDVALFSYHLLSSIQSLQLCLPTHIEMSESGCSSCCYTYISDNNDVKSCPNRVDKRASHTEKCVVVVKTSKNSVVCDESVESIIGDDALVQLGDGRRRTRFRVVPTVGLHRVGGYRNALLSFPNTQWNTVADSGVMRSTLTRGDVGSAQGGNTIRVLSNMVISPPARDEIVKATPTIMADDKRQRKLVGTVSNVRRMHKKRNCEPKVVDIFVTVGELTDYGVLLDRLGPDYKYVVHEMSPNWKCSFGWKGELERDVAGSPPWERTVARALSARGDATLDASYVRVEFPMEWDGFCQHKMAQMRPHRDKVSLEPVVRVTKLSQKTIDRWCHRSAALERMPQIDGDAGAEDESQYDVEVLSLDDNKTLTVHSLLSSFELFAASDTTLKVSCSKFLLPCVPPMRAGEEAVMRSAHSDWKAPQASTSARPWMGRRRRECKVLLRRLPSRVLNYLMNCDASAGKGAARSGRLASFPSVASSVSYRTFTHCLENAASISTPLTDAKPVFSRRKLDRMCECCVVVRRLPDAALRLYLDKCTKRGTSSTSSSLRFDSRVRGGAERYNLRALKVPQVDGAADSSSDDDEDDAVADEVVTTRGRGAQPARVSTRSGRALTVNAGDVRYEYPTLDVIVTQSPCKLRRSRSFTQGHAGCSAWRSPRRRLANKVCSITAAEASAHSHSAANPVTAAQMGAGRRLSVDLGATVVDERVECRYRPAPGCTLRENVLSPSLSQLRQRLIAKSAAARDSQTGPLPTIEDKLPQLEAAERQLNSNVDSSVTSRDKFSVSESARRGAESQGASKVIGVAEPQLSVETPTVKCVEDGAGSDGSDELFVVPPRVLTVPGRRVSEELDVASSLEASILPYQKNQPGDMMVSSCDSRSIFGGGHPAPDGDASTSVAESEELSCSGSPLFVAAEMQVVAGSRPISNLVSKADEYDAANQMLVRPGPSKCPSSLESAIMFASSGSGAEDESAQPLSVNDVRSMGDDLQATIAQEADRIVSVLDLTARLEVSDLLHFGAQQCNTSEATASLDAPSAIGARCSRITPRYRPPSCALVADTMAAYGVPSCRYQEPFYSNAAHVTGAVDVGSDTLRIPARHHHAPFRSSFPTLEDYQRQTAGVTSERDLRMLKLSYCGGKSAFVTPVRRPPTGKEVRLWLLKRRHARKAKRDDAPPDLEAESCKEVQDHDAAEMLGLGVGVEERNSDRVASPTLDRSALENSHAISGVSLDNTHGFKMTLENLQGARALNIYQYITTLAMELHASSRGEKLPDPQTDAVQAIFFALADDVPDRSAGSSPPSASQTGDAVPRALDDQAEHFLKGFVCVSPPRDDGGDVLTGTGIPRTKHVYVVPDETALFRKFIELYHRWNPDILMGYEIEQGSWGYLVERGCALGLNVPALLSRIKDEQQPGKQDAPPPPEELHSHLKVTGRIVLDLWRILKHEIALQSYAFENLAYHVLHERVPRHSAGALSQWWAHAHPRRRHRTADYYLYRVEAAFRLIDHFDLVGRTAELARLFGVLFYEVLSRGSQFRVESMMLRLAKPYGYVPLSPSVQQRARMQAPEHLPLILEPASRFYADPVVVLDFQSLYPSVIIAYNYCFSTCLGRVQHLAAGAPFEFGAYELEVSRKLVGRHLRAGALTVSPCGVAFVGRAVRAGVLPRMLREILDTRLLVKRAMRRHRANRTLQKVLHSRQLGLKLIANVTYGYTAANFSGRMPACELADSVVSKGRETLQRAIDLVERRAEWGARVVYGDTDSMFVLCAGRSREEAFRVGEEIAAAVTDANPSPVRLKLEKVYQPCILQTKKRYVGYMYESSDQKVPVFEAKGIETVRRDGCPAASKMLEKCLKLLFDHRDVSQVRSYVLKQFSKILAGRVSIQDLTFAKEYRGREGYRPGACVPALELTRKWMVTDRRREPRSGERVPYVIVNGPPGLPLIKLVKSPYDLLDDSSLRPNALYYITKAIIPPINRCFKLIGADLFNWFNEMPRKQVQYLHVSSLSKGPKSTISQYFATAACASCGVQTTEGLCPKCLRHPQSTIVALHEKIYMWERNYYSCKKICESCCGRSIDLECDSLDCPVLYRRKQTAHDLRQADFVRSLFHLFPSDTNNLELY